MASALPTVLDVQKAIAKTPARKACGEDGIPADAWKAAPLEAAAILHPLILKAVCYTREPLAWQGGGCCTPFTKARMTQRTATPTGQLSWPTAGPKLPTGSAAPSPSLSTRSMPSTPNAAASRTRGPTWQPAQSEPISR
eukprot:15476621-Alexandrium_andersonii.AAC.1